MASIETCSCGVEVVQGLLDDAVVLLVRIDHDRIIGLVGADAHVLEQPAPDAAAGEPREARVVLSPLLPAAKVFERLPHRAGSTGGTTALIGGARSGRSADPAGAALQGAGAERIEPRLRAGHPGRKLARRRLSGTARPPAPDENIVENLRHLLGTAVAQPVAAQRIAAAVATAPVPWGA